MTDQPLNRMTPAQLRAFVAVCVVQRWGLLVTGPPGGGKSEIIAAGVADAGADSIVSHPVLSDPTEGKGFPWPAADKQSATFLPYGDLARALAATRPTAWVLDDLGQAADAVQASFMQPLQARRAGGRQLPDCVTFIAATNRRADRAAVKGLIEPMKSRFKTIVELVPDLDEWCAWALDNGICAEVVAFLRFRPELLSAFDPSADIVNSPIPRTWSHVSLLMSVELDPATRAAAICGAVGDAAGGEFLAFLSLWAELPNIDGITIDPDSAAIPAQPGTLYAVCTALGRRVTAGNFPRIARYAERLTDANHGEFAALLLRDCIRSEPAVCNTTAFVHLTTGPLQGLISGDAS